MEFETFVFQLLVIAALSFFQILGMLQYLLIKDNHQSPKR